MLYNPSKMNWLNPNIEYLFGSSIIEYDMVNAGFSIIKQFHLLDESSIAELSKLDKNERVIAIGKIRRDDRYFSTRLSNMFSDMRGQFISENNLSDNDILSVKNDAIFTTRLCHRLKFGEIVFIPKNQYSSYIRFVNNSNIEIYYSGDNIDIKGIGDVGINRHRLYLVQFINRIMGDIESSNLSCKRFLRGFIDEYKSMNLDDAYYIEFNNKSYNSDPLFNYQHLLVPIVQIILKELKI